MDMTAGSELTPIPDLTPLTSPDQLPAGDEGAQTFGKLLEEIVELVFHAGGSSILLPADIQLMLDAKKATVAVGTTLEIYLRIKKLKERLRVERVPPPSPPPTPVVVVEEPRRGSLLSAMVVGVVAACTGVAIGFFLGKARSQRKRRQHRRRAPRSDGLASISPSPSPPPPPSILHRLFPSNPPVGPGGGN